MSGAVNSNTPHSPPVCIMFNEIAQYLKFFMFSPMSNKQRQCHNDVVTAEIWAIS